MFTGPQAQPTQQTQHLPGRYEMLSASSSRHHVLYQLRRRGYDTLLTVVVDTLGRVVAQRREHRPGLLARSISEATTVQPVPTNGHLDVWFVEPRKLLLYHTQRSSQRISVERVAY